MESQPRSSSNLFRYRRRPAKGGKQSRRIVWCQHFATFGGSRGCVPLPSERVLDRCVRTGGGCGVSRSTHPQTLRLRAILYSLRTPSLSLVPPSSVL
jgi:hypothetical protein